MVDGQAPESTAASGRRVLLIAYEYPPILSAQSIRWYYLSLELQKLGWQVDVVSVDLAVDKQLALPVPAGVEVYRTFAGPYVGLASRAAARTAGNSESAPGSPARPASPSLAERLYRFGRRVLNQLLFPDVRVEWYWFARAPIKALCARHRYTCLIASHEPGVDLMLAVSGANKSGLPIIADCGDPLATVYTPRWRYWLDLRLERRILTRFDRVVATTDQAGAEFARRHPELEQRLVTITQGTASEVGREPGPRCRVLLEEYRGKFTLLYTGNFYADFRNPEAIFRALERCEFAHLLVVGSAGEDRLDGRLRFIPRLSHFDCLHLQRGSALLLVLGNRQQEQTPGKVFEYLGAGRPILYIYQQFDLGATVVESLERGVCCANEVGQIQSVLEAAYREYRCPGPGAGGGAVDERVAPYLWQNLAARYSEIIADPDCVNRPRNGE